MSSIAQIVNKFWPRSIRGRLILGIALVHLTLMTIFVFDLAIRQREFLKKQNLEQANNFVNEFAVNSTQYIIANDFDQLERFTLYHTNFPHLRYAMVLSNDGIVLAHTNTGHVGKKPTDAISQQLARLNTSTTLIEDDHVLDIAAPIFVDDKIVGWARAGISQDYIQNNLAAIVEDGVFYILIALTVGILFAVIIGNRLTAGFYKLISVAGKIKGGDRDIRVPPFSTLELADLGTSFNQMLDEISAHENLLSSVIENMPVGVWIVNEKKEIISGNMAGKQIWGRQKYGSGDEHELHKGWHVETKKLIEPHQWASVRAIEKNETTINEEIEIETFSGNRKIILNSAIPLKGKEGIIIGAIVINVDITDRKKTIEQLALSESTFRSAFDYSAIGMALVSPAGRILEGNKQLFKMLGYAESDALPLSFQDITHPDDREESLRYQKQAVEGKSDNFHMEKRYLHKNGSIISAHVSISMVRDSQNNPLFAVAQVEDVTERKTTTEQLALSESTFRSAFDHSAIGITLVSPGGNFLRVNKALCRILGYAEKELLSLTFQDITHADDLDEDLIYLKKTLEGKIDSYRMEKRYFHKDGYPIWAHLGVSLVRDSLGQPLFFVSQIEDISERKKSEVLIKESEEKFRKLVEETLVGVFILQEGRFVYVNPRFEKISGYTKTDLVNGILYDKLIHKDDVEKLKRNYASRVLEEKPSNHDTLRGIRKDGTILQVEIIISPISYEGKPAHIGTIIDITEKVEDEKRINKAVADAQENERQQISMELHDNVKQMMAATLLNIDYMKMIVKDDKNAGPVINNIKNYIREAIEELRRISHQLAPSIDASIPLEEKIKTVINTMNVSKSIEINYQFYKLEDDVKADVQLAVYRIVQEQFTNILKHAKASLVDIIVERRNGDICMSIEDNGVGFDTHITKNGIGLENIKRRVQVFDGNFSIQTLPGKGCRLYVQLPVN